MKLKEIGCSDVGKVQLAWYMNLQNEAVLHMVKEKHMAAVGYHRQTDHPLKRIYAIWKLNIQGDS